MVTPMIGDKINYPMMEQLLRRQLECGIRSAVICGTTGESATLTDAEKIDLVRRCKEYAGAQMQIIAGTGSNSTRHAIELSLAAQEAGADALLVVSPYYNKATDEGLIAHYASIAHAVQIPVIIYNVPSRTGVDIPVKVYRQLARIPNIAGVKEASTDIQKFLRIIAECGKDLPVWSGNDAMTVPVIALGGKGVISVSSNVSPALFADMANAALDGDMDTAAALQQQLLPLCDMMFCEVSPVPVKAAMNCIGFDCGSCRLPLTQLSAEHMRQMKAFFQ